MARNRHSASLEFDSTFDHIAFCALKGRTPFMLFANVETLLTMKADVGAGF